MTILQAIILGLIQGLTEFLPVSSSGHLSILQNFFGMNTGENLVLFDVMLHLGTLVSICLVYRKEIAAILADCRTLLRRKSHPVPGQEEQRYPGARLLMMVILGTLPLIIVLPVKDYIEKLYYSTAFIGFMLILTGVMLYVSDRMARGRKRTGSMTPVDALLIGLCQAVATIPGLSRSGTTITAGISRGLDRSFAVKFSFLLSVPAVLGANLLSLFKAIRDGADWSVLPAGLIGMVVAMVSGYFAIGLLHRLVKQGKFGCFAYYCAAVGVITLIVSIFI